MKKCFNNSVGRTSIRECRRACTFYYLYFPAFFNFFFLSRSPLHDEFTKFFVTSDQESRKGVHFLPKRRIIFSTLLPFLSFWTTINFLYYVQRGVVNNITLYLLFSEAYVDTSNTRPFGTR